MASLPDNPSLEHLKGQAKHLHKLVRSKDATALERVGPFFGDPAQVSLQQVQLVIAREYGFSSWTRMKRHIETGLGAQETTEQRANRFLDLVCLHYGSEIMRGTAEFEQAAAILEAHPGIVAHSPHVAAAAGDAQAVAAWLAANPSNVDQLGGPFQWTPLMYAAYARLPGVSSFDAGKLLLKAGADADFHYLWGGTYRFAVLTGIFGDGERGIRRMPEHPDMVRFARAALAAGANPNDSQGAYNRCFSPDNTHLELMLEYGLKDSDLIDWWSTDEPSTAPRTMHWNLLIAMRWGFADRARLLIEHGVDINTPDGHGGATITAGLTPYQAAHMCGMSDIADLIAAKGGDAQPLDGAKAFYAACMSGDRETAERLKADHMGQSPETEARLLQEAAGSGLVRAIETMVALGFELNPENARTPLHAAAWRGQLAAIKVLLDAGGDPKQRDPEHGGPAIGHAMYAQRPDVVELLRNAPMDIFCAAAMGSISQIDARLTEDPAWLNARFAKVFPASLQDHELAWATPLWEAVRHGQWEVAQHLIERGADTTVRDPSGVSLARVAADAGHPQLVPS